MLKINDKEIRAKLDRLCELESLQKEISLNIESLRDELKQELLERNVSELQVGWNILRFTEVESQQLGTTIKRFIIN